MKKLLALALAALFAMPASAQVAISNLPAASAPEGTEVLPIVQSLTTRKLTINQLFTSPTITTPTLVTPNFQTPHLTSGNFFTDGHAIAYGTGANVVVSPGDPTNCNSGTNLCAGGVLTQALTGNYQTGAYYLSPTTGTAPAWGPLVEFGILRTVDQTTNFGRLSWTAMTPYCDVAHADACDGYQMQQEAGGTVEIQPFRFYASYNTTGAVYDYWKTHGGAVGAAQVGDVTFFNRYDPPADDGSNRSLNIGQTTRLGAPVLAAAGQQDGPKLNLFGAAYDTTLHYANWRQYADVTSNAGASTWRLQSQIAATGSGTGGSWTSQLSVVGATGMLAFGDTTSSYPGLRANGASLFARLADDSAYAIVRASQFKLGNGSLIQDSADGLFSLTDAAAATFSRLTLGPATSSFPAFARSGTTVKAVLGDNSATTGFEALYVISTPTVVGSLTACAAGTQGARSFVTDANSTTFLATAVGGGANKVPVVCDGTNWKIG